MPLSINNNELTSGLLNSLSRSQQGQASALEKLASGKKVNSAADNAAALAIINQFSAQITGSSQAARNSSDGISFAQVADSGLQNISENLQRIRELSLQAANGTLSDQQRGALQQEVGQLQQEIGRTLETTRFNNVDVFNTSATISFQVGANSGETIDLTLPDLSSGVASVSAIDISTQSGADSAASVVDSLLQTVELSSSSLGAVQSRFEAAIDNLDSGRINSEAARSRLRDTDYANQSSLLVQNNIQQQAGIAIQSQANASAQLVLNLLA